MARLIIAWACRGLAANSMSPGMPAPRHRSRSSVQDCGRYSSRSINARPCTDAYARNTPTWQPWHRPQITRICTLTYDTVTSQATEQIGGPASGYQPGFA